jgi:tetratricopeptide (TPR) repeat protein
VGRFYLYHNSDTAAALKFAHSALTLAVSHGLARRHAQALHDLASIHCQIGDYLAAQKYAFQSRTSALSSGELYSEVFASKTEVDCWAALGHYGHAVRISQRATYLLGLCGLANGELASAVLNSRAEIHTWKSEYAEAHQIHSDILHKSGIPPNTYRHGLVLLNLTIVDVIIGAPRDMVQRNRDKAASIFKTMGYLRLVEWCDILQADIELREGNLSAADKGYQRGLAASRGNDDEKTTYCLGKLGDRASWSNGHYQMTHWTLLFLVHALNSKQKLAIHKALQFLGDVFLDQGERDTATSLFTIALEGFVHMDVHQNKAECMLRLGDLSAQDGELPKAIELWKTARPLFKRATQERQVAIIDERPAGASVEHM